MTLAPNAQPIAAADPRAAIDVLRAQGLRITTPRRLVIESLFAADAPVTAADLARSLTMDESSVYRNLEVLEQHGLVRHLHLGHGPGLYALTSRQHEYLYCEQCRTVTAVAPAELDEVRELVRDRFGLTPRFTHWALVGLCAACDAEQSSDEEGGGGTH